MPTNPQDFVQAQVTLDTSTWIEVTAAQNCIAAEIRQLPSETPQIIKVRHRSATDTNHEEIPTSGVLRKGDYMGQAKPGLKSIKAGDTLGFFQGTSGTPKIQVKLFER